MEQWKGFKGRFAVRKDGGDVDAITASTITSRAYTLAVKNAVEFVLALTGGAAAETQDAAEEAAEVEVASVEEAAEVADVESNMED